MKKLDPAKAKSFEETVLVEGEEVNAEEFKKVVEIEETAKVEAKVEAAGRQRVMFLGGVSGAGIGALLVWGLDSAANAGGAFLGVNLDIINSPTEHGSLVAMCYSIGGWIADRLNSYAAKSPWAKGLSKFLKGVSDNRAKV